MTATVSNLDTHRTPLRREDAAGVAAAAVALSSALRVWQYRDDTKPQPEVRRAGTAGIHAIDRALAELHRLRGNLVSELRVSDDAAERRIDTLLADTRAARESGGW